MFEPFQEFYIFYFYKQDILKIISDIVLPIS